MADCYGGKDNVSVRILVAIRSYFNEAKALSGILKIIKGSKQESRKEYFICSYREVSLAFYPLADLGVS